MVRGQDEACMHTRCLTVAEARVQQGAADTLPMVRWQHEELGQMPHAITHHTMRVADNPALAEAGGLVCDPVARMRRRSHMSTRADMVRPTHVEAHCAPHHVERG